jgi:hypothetical protein
MSLMTDAVELHLDTLLDPEVAGELVEIRMGSSSVDIWAAMGKTDWDEPTGGDAGETYIGTSSTDFIVRRSDIVLGGSPIVPERGMLVIRSNGSEYGVMPGLNSAPAEPNDGQEKMFRIHTQKRKQAKS